MKEQPKYQIATVLKRDGDIIVLPLSLPCDILWEMVLLQIAEFSP